AEAAALEFAGIDDAEVWYYDTVRFDGVRRPNLAQILVETGRDEALAVFLDKAAGVSVAAQARAVSAAAAAYAATGNLPEVRALITPFINGERPSPDVLIPLRVSMVQRGDVDGLLWLDTLLRGIERSGASFPKGFFSYRHILNSVPAAELSERLLGGGAENCAELQGGPGSWTGTYGAASRSPGNDDLIALLSLCFRCPLKKDAAVPLDAFDPLSAPIRIRDPALGAKLRRAIVTGAGLDTKADGTPPEGLEVPYRNRARAAILTLFEAGQAQDLLVHWMTRGYGDDALASGFAFALGTALATGNRPDLLRQLSDPPSALDWDTQLGFAMLFAVYGAIAGDEALIAAALEGTGMNDWSESVNLLVLRLSGNVPFSICE
ncbi:MAG: hypothetical protein ACK5PT_01150, partial [Cereibacter sp.]